MNYHRSVDVFNVRDIPPSRSATVRLTAGGISHAFVLAFFMPPVPPNKRALRQVQPAASSAIRALHNLVQAYQ